MRRLAIMSVLAVALAGALVVAPSQAKPAEARVSLSSGYDALEQAASNMGIRYGISIYRACRTQYPGLVSIAQSWSYSNPYSWACYEVLSWVPARHRYLGGLDLNRYCRETHGPFYAKLTEPWLGAFGWSCVRGGYA